MFHLHYARLPAEPRRRRRGPALEGTGVVIAFWVLAALTVGSAAMIVVVRNLVTRCPVPILSFVGMAGVFITLSADFVAVVQVLIYAGAIAVLMLFAIMLSPRSARDNAGTCCGARRSSSAGCVARSDVCRA